MSKHKFLIQPHFRLHEWVAEEKGYFTAERLDYEFQETVQSTDGRSHAQGDKVGAMQSFEKGRSSDISCACHWAVNQASSQHIGAMWQDAYVVTPGGIMVPPESRTPPVRLTVSPGAIQPLSVEIDAVFGTIRTMSLTCALGCGPPE